MWAELYRQHQEARKLPPAALSDVRKELIRFAEQGRITATISSRFTNRSNRGLTEWYIAGTSGREAVTVPGFGGADLAIDALTDKRQRHLHQFSAMLQGVTEDGQPWTVAVHVEDDRREPDHDRKGAGAATHAVYHCHVGPNLDAKPKVRVPLPAMTPAQAVAWLLALVDARMEPLPWEEFAR